MTYIQKVMDRYVYIQSDDNNKDYFYDNESYKFKVHLKYPLVLTGTWKVGLTAFYTSLTRSQRLTDTALYVYCDFCKESVIHGQLQKLLRCIPMTKQNKWEHMFQNVYYLPVSKQEIFEMEFYIKTRNGQDASFLNKPVILELHFKYYPYL